MSEEGVEDFSAIYTANLSRVYGFIGYRVRSKHEAEDLTQLVFEKALRAWPRYDATRSQPPTWLLAIAKNVLIDHLRRRREALIGDDMIADLSGGEEGEQAGLSPELAAAVSTLSAREQTVIALRFGADMTGPEIAELLELSTDNAHQILSRSLRKIRSTLDAS